MLTHLRLYDSKSMTHKIGQLPSGHFKPIVKALSGLLDTQKAPKSKI